MVKNNFANGETLILFDHVGWAIPCHVCMKIQKRCIDYSRIGEVG